MSYAHRRRYSKKYNKGRFQKLGKKVSTFHIPGHFGNEPKPDVLYSTFKVRYGSGQGQFSSGTSPSMYVPSGSVYQANATNVAPCGIMCNYATPRILPGFSNSWTGLSTPNTALIGSMNQWASYYQYGCIYKTDIVLEVQAPYSIEIMNDTSEETGVWLAIPCAQNPASGESNWVNPWNIQLNTPPESLYRTPRMVYHKMGSAPRSDGGDHRKFKMQWRLKDCGDKDERWLYKSICVSNGTSFADPVDANSNNAAFIQPAYWFAGIWGGRVAQAELMMNWMVDVTFHFKCWQPRQSLVAPSLGLKLNERVDPGDIWTDPEGFLKILEARKREEEEDQEMIDNFSDIVSTPIDKKLGRLQVQPVETPRMTSRGPIPKLK